jgi:hypothetical protein
MGSGMQTVIYSVKDVESAKKVYTALLGIRLPTRRQTTSAGTSVARTSDSTPTATGTG